MAFEIKRVHVQAKANTAGLLNPRKKVAGKVIGAMPLRMRHCRFPPENLIERPIVSLLFPALP
jgi:hypothetical protein